MNKILIAVILGMFSIKIAFAADVTCEAKAAEKKLAGAAKSSFIKKCVKDSGVSSCDTQAADKKLYGAAKSSFVKKCEKDAAAK
jgi:hypothetical protein